jgi:hypothetical protein
LVSSHNLEAKSSPKHNIKDLFLAKGEQVTLRVPRMSQYSVGNKEVIKHIYKKSSEELFIKGKSLGFTDMIVWRGKKKQVYNIYILSKRKQLEKMQVANTLKKLHLDLKVSGELIIASGQVKSLESYLIIQGLIKEKIPNLILNLTLSKKLLKNIYADIYNKSYLFGATLVLCKSNNLNIFCSLEGLSIKSYFIKDLSQRYNIKFDYNISNVKDKNYLAKFKIIQIESLQRSKTKVGIADLSSSLLKLIQGDHIALIEGEAIEVSELNIRATLLSEPQTVITIDTKAKLSLGGEIPVQQSSNSVMSTTWKFFGLKLTALLKNKNGKAFVHYKTTLTTPRDNAIEGTKASASVFVSLNQYNKLFEIGHIFTEQQKMGVPLLQEIPFLKHLFSSSGEVGSYKHIVCYLNLEDINE